MAMWLYQLSQKVWSLNNYRLDIWEGERWEWEVGKVTGSVSVPRPGDTVAGFYGWAVILLWTTEEKQRFYFRPVPPSDQLKMRPWWDKKAEEIADKVRQPVKMGTLWPVTDDLAAELGAGISAWVSG